METNWRKIPTFPDYEVSDDGKVRKTETGIELKQNNSRVTMSYKGKQYNRFVPKIVRQVFGIDSRKHPMFSRHAGRTKEIIVNF